MVEEIRKRKLIEINENELANKGRKKDDINCEK